MKQSAIGVVFTLLTSSSIAAFGGVVCDPFSPAPVAVDSIAVTQRNSNQIDLRAKQFYRENVRMGVLGASVTDLLSFYQSLRSEYQKATPPGVRPDPLGFSYRDVMAQVIERIGAISYERYDKIKAGNYFLLEPALTIAQEWSIVQRLKASYLNVSQLRYVEHISFRQSIEALVTLLETNKEDLQLARKEPLAAEVQIEIDKLKSPAVTEGRSLIFPTYSKFPDDVFEHFNSHGVVLIRLFDVDRLIGDGPFTFKGGF